MVPNIPPPQLSDIISRVDHTTTNGCLNTPVHNPDGGPDGRGAVDFEHNGTCLNGAWNNDFNIDTNGGMTTVILFQYKY